MNRRSAVGVANLFSLQAAEEEGVRLSPVPVRARPPEPASKSMRALWRRVRPPLQSKQFHQEGSRIHPFLACGLGNKLCFSNCG